MKNKNKLMISVSGIRGIVGITLTIEDVIKYSQAFGIFSQGTTIAVGRDTRVSGEMYKNAVISALLSVGKSVIDLGIVATPTLLLYVEKHKLDGGIVITSSHNPSEWNALKLVHKDGRFINKLESKKFLSVINEINEVDWTAIKKVHYDPSATKEHINLIANLPIIDVELIRSRQFKVVIDPVNGAGSETLPPLLDFFNCNYKVIHSSGDGIFERIAEPRGENLSALEKVVSQWNADIGFAVDPDVDRLSIVDDIGKSIGEEYTLPLVADFILSKTQAKNPVIVTNLSTSSLLDFVAKKYNGNLLRTPVGEANVVKIMQETNSIIGGEGNGGIIYPELHYTRDSLVGIALILQMIAERDIKISSLITDYPKINMIKTSLPLKTDFDLGIIKKHFKNEKFNEDDGLKILGKDWWIHIRKSGTEPIIRIYIEGNNGHITQSLLTRIEAILNKKERK